MQIKMQGQGKEKTITSLSFCSGIVEENKQASKPKSACLVESSAALKHNARVESVLFNTTDNYRAQLLTCLFVSTIPEQKERLLMV